MFEQLLARASAWIDTPTGSAVLIWILLAVVTAIVKPRTPEAYAKLASRYPSWLWSRVAAALQLVGGLGIDPQKVAFALAKLITGHVVSSADMQRGTASKPASGDSDDGDGSGSSAMGASGVAPKEQSAIRHLAALPGVGAVLLAGCILLAGCSLFTKQNAKTALDIAETACVIANATLPDSKVAEVCGIADNFIGPMRSLLASTRAAAAARHAGASQSIDAPPVVCASTNNGVECWAAGTR